MTADDLKEVIRWGCRNTFGFLAGFAIVAFIGAISPLGRDDSDPGQWGRRSGIKPRIDALTGCQYLETSAGSLTPRLGRDGRQVGCER